MIYRQGITNATLIVNGDAYNGELLIYEHDKVGLAIYQDGEDIPIHKIDLGDLHRFINELVDCGEMLESFIHKRVRQYVNEQNIF